MDIEYKGYLAKVFFSGDVGLFYGEILNTRDLLCFQAASLQEAINGLQQTVDRYLEEAQLGVEHKEQEPYT